MRRHMVLPVLALCLLLAAPATAQPPGPDDMNLCLCVNALSRLLCKKKNEMAFVAKTGEGVYAFSVFYGSQPSRYTCAVAEDAIYIRSETGRKFLRTIPYTFDASKMCGTFSLTLPDCPIGGTAKCCGVKSAKQLHIEKEDAFWSRPIPQILQDELKQGTFGNATEAEPATPTPSGTRPAGP